MAIKKRHKRNRKSNNRESYDRCVEQSGRYTVVIVHFRCFFDNGKLGEGDRDHVLLANKLVAITRKMPNFGAPKRFLINFLHEVVRAERLRKLMEFALLRSLSRIAYQLFFCNCVRISDSSWHEM